MSRLYRGNGYIISMVGDGGTSAMPVYKKGTYLEIDETAKDRDVEEVSMALWVPLRYVT